VYRKVLCGITGAGENSKEASPEMYACIFNYDAPRPWQCALSCLSFFQGCLDDDTCEYWQRQNHRKTLLTTPRIHCFRLWSFTLSSNRNASDPRLWCVYRMVPIIRPCIIGASASISRTSAFQLFSSSISKGLDKKRYTSIVLFRRIGNPDSSITSTRCAVPSLTSFVATVEVRLYRHTLQLYYPVLLSQHLRHYSVLVLGELQYHLGHFRLDYSEDALWAYTGSSPYTTSPAL